MLWDKLNQELDKQNMSVYRLAKRTGIRDTTLWSYRHGVEPSFKNVCKIADALGVSLDYFREDD